MVHWPTSCITLSSSHIKVREERGRSNQLKRCKCYDIEASAEALHTLSSEKDRLFLVLKAALQVISLKTSSCLLDQWRVRKTWPIILAQYSFKKWWVWPGPPCFHRNSLWTIWNRSFNILCEPSLLPSLRHPSLKFFKVSYQGTCLRDGSLQAGWPTYSASPSLFTLVSRSFSIHLPGVYLLIYRLLSHSPSIILFCGVQGLGVNAFSQGSPTVFPHQARQSVLQRGDSSNSKTSRFTAKSLQWCATSVWHLSYLSKIISGGWIWENMIIQERKCNCKQIWYASKYPTHCLRNCFIHNSKCAFFFSSTCNSTRKLCSLST